MTTTDHTTAVPTALDAPCPAWCQLQAAGHAELPPDIDPGVGTELRTHVRDVGAGERWEVSVTRLDDVDGPMGTPDIVVRLANDYVTAAEAREVAAALVQAADLLEDAGSR